MNPKDLGRLVREEVAESTDEDLAKVYRERLEEDQEADQIVDEILRNKGRR